MTRALRITLLGAFLLGGCVSERGAGVSGPPPVADRGIGRTAPDGLRLTLYLPKQRFVAGEQFVVRLVAQNAGDREIEIPAGAGAAMTVRLWRRARGDWDEVKVYPLAAERTVRPWRLTPGSERRFEMRLTVSPDWPTHDPLALVAELNGRADLQVLQTITVVWPSEDVGGGRRQTEPDDGQ